MSTTTLQRLELRHEQVSIRTDVSREIGASACGGCPLLAIGCPGKSEAILDCPPAAVEIKKEEIREKLLDDTVAAVSIDGLGGFIALPDKEKQFQTASILPPRPKSTQPARKPVVARSKPPIQEKVPRRMREPGVFAMLGELAAMLFISTPTVPAKK